LRVGLSAPSFSGIRAFARPPEKSFRFNPSRKKDAFGCGLEMINMFALASLRTNCVSLTRRGKARSGAGWKLINVHFLASLRKRKSIPHAKDSMLTTETILR
jgi:hypothetical protein